jgi:DNA repair protein RadC
MSLQALPRFDEPLVSEDASDAALLSRLIGDGARAAPLLAALSLPRLLCAGHDELRIAGLDEESALRLRAALELGRRAVDRPLQRGVSLRCSTDVTAHLRGRLLALEQEQLHVLGVDSQNRLLAHAVAATGRINQVYVSGADVFRPLVREAAAGAIVVHNHPSGDHAPSEADVDLTRRLADIGALLGIPLLDHIVMARGGEFSFAHHGLLPQKA